MPVTGSPEKNRIYVLTDISEEEPDDLQSLIRLLLYADVLEIEGLVATLSEWKSINGSGFRPDLIHQALDAYEKVWPNLRAHSPGYPPAEHLRQRVWMGNGNDLASTGPGKQSQGAEALCASLLRPNPRPLWVAVWGGAATLAQALCSLERKLSRQTFAAVTDQLWVYEIQGQDDCGAWCCHRWPHLHWIRSQFQWRGMSNRVDGVWPEPRRFQDEVVAPEWFQRHIQSGHGPLGVLYPDARFMFEGDTPSILHLIPNGLHNPVELPQGGWGGRFLPDKSRNVWSGGCPVNDESRFGDFHMHTDAADGRVVEGNGKLSVNVYNPLRRWRRAYQHDFAARMDRCVLSPEEVSQPPRIRVNGAEGTDIPTLPLPGNGDIRIEMDAGHADLTLWFYREPGPGGPSPEITQDQKGRFLVRPGPARPGRHHLIAEARAPNRGLDLYGYRRLLINIAPEANSYPSNQKENHS